MPPARASGGCTWPRGLTEVARRPRAATKAHGTRRPPNGARDTRADRDRDSRRRQDRQRPRRWSAAPSAAPSGCRCRVTTSSATTRSPAPIPVIPADTYKLDRRRHGRRAAQPDRDGPPLHEADPSRPPLPVRHGLVRAERATGRACSCPTCLRAGRCQLRGDGTSLLLRPTAPTPRASRFPRPICPTSSSPTRCSAPTSPPSTAAPCGSTSRPCTATSRSSG